MGVPTIISKLSIAFGGICYNGIRLVEIITFISKSHMYIVVFKFKL